MFSRSINHNRSHSFRLQKLLTVNPFLAHPAHFFLERLKYHTALFLVGSHVQVQIADLPALRLRFVHATILQSLQRQSALTELRMQCKELREKMRGSNGASIRYFACARSFKIALAAKLRLNPDVVHRATLERIVQKTDPAFRSDRRSAAAHLPEDQAEMSIETTFASSPKHRRISLFEPETWQD